MWGNILRARSQEDHLHSCILNSLDGARLQTQRGRDCCSFKATAADVSVHALHISIWSGRCVSGVFIAICEADLGIWAPVRQDQ